MTIEWSDTQVVYDGDVHRPSYVVKDRDGAVVTDGNIQDVLVFDGYEYKSEIGTYTIKVTLTDSDNYFIRSGAVC